MSPAPSTVRNAQPVPSCPEATPAADPERWLCAAREGNAQAFVQLVRAEQGRVFSIALRMVGRRDDAEEIAQDVFLQLHGMLDRIESASHLRHWLLRAVSHRAIDALRRRSRQPRLVAEAEGAIVAVPEDGADHLLHRRLAALLLQLPETARAVVVLRFQEDLDPLDIAAVLALPLNTVKSHLRRSLEWLRQQALETEDGS